MSNNILKVFVAAPNDVNEEREIVYKVIDEVNVSTKNITGITLQVVGLDSDVRSKITGRDDGQEIIDEQMLNKYDIFIGILWKNFGTPTTKSMSGTEQEFRNALRKLEDDPESIDIMFYFCNKAPEFLDDISPEQLGLIKNFKNDLKEKGLYFNYSNNIEFEELIRKDLSLLITEKNNKNKQSKDSESSNYNEKKPEEMSIGILDLFENFNENVELGANDLKEYTVEVKKFSENITLGSEFNPNDLDSVKKTVNLISDHMDKFSETTDYYSSQTKNHFFKALDSFINLSENYKSNIFANDEQFEETKSTLEELDNEIKKAIISIKKGLIENIDNIPPITTKFNKSKNRLVQSSQNLIKNFNNIRKMVNDAYKTLNSLDN